MATATGVALILDVARALVLARAALAVAIDVPEANGALAASLQQLGFANSFATARMYRGPAPLAGPTLQTIATRELG